VDEVTCRGVREGTVRGPYRRRRGTKLERVLKWARQQPGKFTTREATEALGLEARLVSSILCALRDRGLLERADMAEGRGNWAQWIDPRKVQEW